MYLVGYQRQAQGAELINADNRLFDPETWRVVAEGLEVVDGFDGGRVHELRLRSAGKALRLWSWFRTAGTSTTSDVAVKWMEITEVLAGRADSAALVAIAAADEEEADAVALLTAFLAAHEHAIAACIDDPVTNGCAP